MWRAISIGFTVPGLALLIYSATLWQQYRISLPRTPDNATGRVYPRNVHGIVVFQSHAEEFKLDAIQDVAFGAFFLGLLLGGIEEWYWKRTIKKQS